MFIGSRPEFLDHIRGFNRNHQSRKIGKIHFQGKYRAMLLMSAGIAIMTNQVIVIVKLISRAQAE
jgi:hypothetical protein